MRLASGTRLGPYEILDAIGVGGMGEVYRAKDHTLGRDVAIKILPPLVADDPERLARFRREARVLASLNHPQICSIYGFEDSSGIHALVLELVEGDTLAVRIARGPLRPGDARPIATQIAHALDTAHAAGIVHRDLKPANVKVRGDGAVKVLDFGLAKALSTAGSESGAAALVTQTSTQSAHGSITGTPAYMSPEQARGEIVDKRTDIWAFGCLLYEMLTGRRAFEGSTVSDTLVAILSKDPDWSLLPSDTPPRIVSLMRRCLQRDPRQRLRDIGDAIPDLEAAHEPLIDKRPSWGPWLISGLAMAGVVALGIALWLGFLQGRSPTAPSALATVDLEQLTHDSGLSTMPAISRDGLFVAYASDRSGRQDLDIWIQRAAGGEPLRLTDDPSEDLAPDFSPDGTQVIFRSERNGGGAYVVASLGGRARLLIPGARDPRFSPDGSRVAYWSGQFRGDLANAPSGVYVAPLVGGAPVRLLSDFRSARNPVWSPDGRALLVLARSTDTRESAADWWRVPIDGGTPVKTGLSAAIDTEGDVKATWTAGGIIVAARGDLWRVPLSPAGTAGPPERLTAGARNADLPAVAADGTVVFAAGKTERQISRASLVTGDAPVVLFSDERSSVRRASTSADGMTIVFERWYPQQTEIWVKDLHDGSQRLITRVEDSRGVNPIVSADGRRVLYTLGPEGNASGYLVDIAGGTPQKVCSPCTVWNGFLPDGHRIVSVTGRRIEVIDTRDGSRTEPLVANAGAFTRPHVSPDGRWLAFRHAITSDLLEWKSYVAPFTPGAPAPRERWQQVDEPTTTGRPTGWSADSRTLYLLLDTDGFRCVWGQRIDAAGHLLGKPTEVRHFHETNISTSAGNPVTAQGFLYERPARQGNIWKLLGH